MCMEHPSILHRITRDMGTRHLGQHGALDRVPTHHTHYRQFSTYTTYIWTEMGRTGNRCTLGQRLVACPWCILQFQGNVFMSKYKLAFNSKDGSNKYNCILLISDVVVVIVILELSAACCSKTQISNKACPFNDPSKVTPLELCLD